MSSIDFEHQIPYSLLMQKIYEEIFQELLSYRTGSLHPFVSKNTKKGDSWHEPTMAHFQKLINKYDKLRQQSDQK
jgi:hypothetical protein